MVKSVYVEGDWNQDYKEMWRRWGWTIVHAPEDADVIQFTGGEDVHPSYYDEVPHPLAGTNKRRDEHCFDIFYLAKQFDIPMAGICRGGQFLNVANGGKMFQHCDGHAIGGTHPAVILESGLVVDVTSTHHQIMRPNRDKGIVLMEANPKLGTFKECREFRDEAPHWPIVNRQEEDDVEAVFYPDTMSLCFQPHPEWCKETSSCVSAYKSFLRNYLELNV